MMNPVPREIGSPVETPCVADEQRPQLVMITVRNLVVILVLAQFVTMSVHQVSEAVTAGVIKPLMAFAWLNTDVGIKVGIFDVGIVMQSLFYAIISILLALVVLRVLLKFCWRWLVKAIPESTAPGDHS
jgi:hypothetical protein